MSGHTPGPWVAVHQSEVHENRFEVAEIDSCRIIVEGVLWPDKYGAPQDDARLIAAAPEQHDALVQWANAERTGDPVELANARIARDRAIAKATGVE